MNKKQDKMVRVDFYQKSADSYLSFRCKISLATAGKIMAFIGTLPENEKKMLKPRRNHEN